MTRKMPLASMFAMAGALASFLGIPGPNLTLKPKKLGKYGFPINQQINIAGEEHARGTPGCERSSKRRQRRMRAKARKLAK